MGKDSAEKIKEYLKSLDELVYVLKKSSNTGANRASVSGNTRLFNEITKEVYDLIQGAREKEVPSIIQLVSHVLERYGAVLSIVGKIDTVNNSKQKIERWVSGLKVKHSPRYEPVAGFSKRLFPFSAGLMDGGADWVGVQYHGIKIEDADGVKYLLQERGVPIRSVEDHYYFDAKYVVGGYYYLDWLDFTSYLMSIFFRFTPKAVESDKTNVFAYLAWLLDNVVDGYSFYVYSDGKKAFKKISFETLLDFWKELKKVLGEKKPVSMAVDLRMAGEALKRPEKEIAGYKQYREYREDGVRIIIPLRSDDKYPEEFKSYINCILKEFDGKGAHIRNQKNPVYDSAITIHFKL